jgi:hypothetical protein
MPEAIADPPVPSSCYSPVFGPGIQESQPLGPDLFSARARDARGRFAKGCSGNPRGRPPGIPNPKRRVLDLVARPLAPQALSDLLARKPHLFRPLAAQLLPLARASIDPVERLGLDLSSLRTPKHFEQALLTVWAAVSDGEIAPAEAARIAWRVRARFAPPEWLRAPPQRFKNPVCKADRSQRCRERVRRHSASTMSAACCARPRC